LVEFHNTLKRLHIPTTQQFRAQQPEKTQQAPMQKEREETIQIVM